eukprot:630231-Rhodomonas_salina.2
MNTQELKVAAPEKQTCVGVAGHARVGVGRAEPAQDSLHLLLLLLCIHRLLRHNLTAHRLFAGHDVEDEVRGVVERCALGTHWSDAPAEPEEKGEQVRGSSEEHETWEGSGRGRAREGEGRERREGREGTVVDDVALGHDGHGVEHLEDSESGLVDAEHDCPPVLREHAPRQRRVWRKGRKEGESGR